MEIIKKKILVFGGSSSFANSFYNYKKNNYDFIFVENSSSINLPVRKLKLNDKNLEDKIKSSKVNFAINLIALTNVDQCEKNPVKADFLNNKLAKKIAIMMNKLSIKLIHVSTDQVFNGKKNIYNEKDKAKPINIYGLTKLKGEKSVHTSHKCSIVLRTNFVGWDFQHKDKFLDKIFKNLSLDKKVKIPKNIFFNPVTTYELSDAIEKIIFKDFQKNDLFHISSSFKISKYDFVKKLARKLNYNINLVEPYFYNNHRTKIKRPEIMVLNNKKYSLKYGYRFKSLSQQITFLIKEYQARVIPYGKHSISINDIDSMSSLLKSDSLTQGPIIDQFEKKIKNYVGAKYAVAVSSCSAGLHLAIQALNFGKNDTIISSPISFVSTTNAALHNRSKILFSDINLNNLSLDLDKLEHVLKRKKINCVIPVHLTGDTCDMQKLSTLSKKYNFKIIEDSAHALGSYYNKISKVGSCKYSDMSIFSFHPVKLIAAGEGGMITTNNYDLYKKLLRLRSHGINKLNDNFIYSKQASTDNVDNPWYYEMQDLGFHYRITDLQSNLALSQMRNIKKYLSKRKKIAKYYDNNLHNLNNLKIYQRGRRDLSANHLYVVNIDFNKCKFSRASLMTKMRELGIVTQVHYIPIPMHPYYSKLGFNMNNLANAKNYYNHCLSLPIFYDLSEHQQKYVVDFLKTYVG